jgi:uncharacterized protein YprB with RNaseH-like and TPR domain
MLLPGSRDAFRTASRHPCRDFRRSHKQSMGGGPPEKLAAEAAPAGAAALSISLQKLRALRLQVGGAALPGPTGHPAPPQGGRQAVNPEPANDSPHPPLPAQHPESAVQSIESLRRLLGVRGRTLVPLRARGSVDRSLPGIELSPGLRLVEAHLPMPIPTAALSLAFAVRTTPVRNRVQILGNATPAAADPRDLLFFDTETTGLAGGTGTRAFMVGAADFHRHPEHGDGLRVRQLLIATMAAEADMLRAFAGWLAPRTVLASYNGRCYDAPLLKTRYRLARQPDPLRDLAHVDLLFPSRRRWRGRWENCRLATIEREALGVVREDDLPGSQAPAAWLHYLRGGSSSLLRRVAAHNHQDVVTLALLMAKLVELQAEDAARAD